MVIAASAASFNSPDVVLPTQHRIPDDIRRGALEVEAGIVHRLATQREFLARLQARPQTPQTARTIGEMEESIRQTEARLAAFRKTLARPPRTQPATAEELTQARANAHAAVAKVRATLAKAPARPVQKQPVPAPK